MVKKAVILCTIIFLALPYSVAGYTAGVKAGNYARYSAVDTTGDGLREVYVQVNNVVLSNVSLLVKKYTTNITLTEEISVNISAAFTEYVIPANLQQNDKIPGTNITLSQTSTKIICNEYRSVVYGRHVYIIDGSESTTEYEWDISTGLLTWMKKTYNSTNYIELTLVDTNAWIPLLIPGIIVAVVVSTVVGVFIWLKKRRK